MAKGKKKIEGSLAERIDVLESTLFARPDNMKTYTPEEFQPRQGAPAFLAETLVLLAREVEALKKGGGGE